MRELPGRQFVTLTGWLMMFVPIPLVRVGMVPLSGFEQSPIAPMWHRIGAFLYEHGEAVYKFQGLRAYKESSTRIWEQHHLAYPGGLRLPHILADVSALVAGGYRRIFLK